MRTKNFVLFLSGVVAVSFLLIVFGQNKPETIQNIVSTTNQQIKNFKDNLRDVQKKKFVADEKYLSALGLVEPTRLYPENIWKNTSLPVIVTYVLEGYESQAVGLVNNIARVLPNNTILVYNLGLGEYSLKKLLNYCNSTRCQVVALDLSDFPSHVYEENFHAFRPLVIQDALSRTGAIFFIECNYRLQKHVSATTIQNLFEKYAKDKGILAWPMKSKNPVSSLTHKKMFEYFHTEAENFLFLQMVYADLLMIVNTKSIQSEVMLPWIQCTLTVDCLVPIGAQSAGCKFDKKPIYRYSGCHSYDTSALNIALGLKFKLDDSEYTFGDVDEIFEKVTLNHAHEALRALEQNVTTDGRTSLIESA